MGELELVVDSSLSLPQPVASEIENSKKSVLRRIRAIFLIEPQVESWVRSQSKVGGRPFYGPPPDVASVIGLRRIERRQW